MLNGQSCQKSLYTSTILLRGRRLVRVHDVLELACSASLEAVIYAIKMPGFIGIWLVVEVGYTRLQSHFGCEETTCHEMRVKQDGWTLLHLPQCQDFVSIAPVYRDITNTNRRPLLCLDLTLTLERTTTVCSRVLCLGHVRRAEMSFLEPLRTLYSLDTLDSRLTTSSKTPSVKPDNSIAEAKLPAQNIVSKSNREQLPRVQPSRWNTKEFYFYYLCFLTIPIFMVKSVYDVSKGIFSRPIRML